MSLSYSTTIPAANNDPADDQLQMQTNFASINTLIGVDHVQFASGAYGTHDQVTFSSENTPSTPTDPVSVLYTAAGTASSVANLLYVNQNATFPVSLIRAFGFGTASGITSSQSYNVQTFTRIAAGQYTIALTSGAVSSSNFAVLVSGTMTNSFIIGVYPGYVITGTGTFQLNFHAITGNFGTDPTSFSFMVLQI